MGKLIFATGNKGKLKEVKQIFENTSYEIIAPFELGNDVDVEETETTFEGNAFLKAKAIYDIYRTPVIADDSGLEVDALDGVPGVYSARYAGKNCTFDDNNNKLLKVLNNPSLPRTARFVACAIFYDGTKKIVSTGYLEGSIAHEKTGAMGFGYDPVFIPKGADRTLGQYSFEEKNKMSHRYKAFEGLKEKMKQLT